MQKDKFKVGDRIINRAKNSNTEGSCGYIVGFHRNLDIIYVKYDDESYNDFDSSYSDKNSIENLIKIEPCNCTCNCK